MLRKIVCLVALFGCVGGDQDVEFDEEVGSTEQELVDLAFFGTDRPTHRNTLIGLALEIDNGEGIPVSVRSGQRFFINQIDIRASAPASTDNPGLEALRATSDFASLDWSGLEQREHEPQLLSNADGTFTDRRFYRDAEWMEGRGRLRVWQVDEHGRRVSRKIRLSTGTDNSRGLFDAFFVRRFRAIQWANDCAAVDDCSTATDFMEEGLVELRNTRNSLNSFRIHRRAVALRMSWSERSGEPYEIPLTQVSDPDYDYGFNIVVEAVTPPGPHGYYEPGTDVTFQLTLQDGSGAPLHNSGTLPSYADVVFGTETSGIEYYRAFFDPSATFWRRKHRERMLMAQMIGPNQDIQAIRTIAPLGVFLDEEDTEVVGTPAVDGVYAEFTLLPPANVIFLGAFTPGNPQWFEPNVDTFTFHIPEDAGIGTYKVTLKGRRVYLGEDIPRTTTIEIQVGTNDATYPVLTTGPCTSCHSGGGALDVVLHANDDRAACAGCHVPLGFELEGPVFVRTHFIHSRSDRFDAPLERCSNCHLDEDSIQRTSKAACLSCHVEYPETHVAWFGEIESAYIGGNAESFEQCTDSCHVEHPGDAF